MSTTPAPQASSFRIGTIEGWWDLPLDSPTRDADIAAFVEERRQDAEPELVDLITEIMKEAAVTAERLGASLCAEYSAVDDEGRPVGANLMVMEIPGARQGNLEVELATMVEQASAADRETTRPQFSLVDLPYAGRAIRMRTDPPPENPDAPDALRSLRLQFFVPIPGAPTTALLTFSAPVVTGHEPHDLLIELFDAMAETFCFLDEDGKPLVPTFAQPSQP